MGSCACPFDQRIFSTVYSSGETYGAAVWQIPELYGKLSSPQLESVASLDAHTCRIRRKTESIERAYARNVDYDTKKRYMLVTAEDESGIDICDLRKLKFPVAYLPGHSHCLVESPAKAIEQLIHSYSDYEDGVYGLAWSSREPWIFALLSYDGSVVVEPIKPYLEKK